MKKEFVGRFPVWASIFDGRTHIDRRVYVDDLGERFVKINGNFVDYGWMSTRWQVEFYW